MAQGLMNLSNLLGQSSNATQGGLIGGGVFSQPMSRGQRRSKLLTDAISSAGANPYARLGASFGGLIGMGARAGAEGLGIVDKPPEVQQAEAIKQVQQEVAERGLDPTTNPREFGQYVSSRFQELGQSDLATRSLLQARQLESQFAPEPVETERVIRGGTKLGEAAGLREGESAVGTFVNGQRTSLSDVERQEQPERFTPLTPEEKQAIGIDPTKFAQRNNLTGRVHTSGGQTINVGDEADPAFDALTDQFKNDLTQASEAATQATGLLEEVNRATDILSQGDFSTGRVRPVLTSLRGIAEDLGVSVDPALRQAGVENLGDVSDAESFRAFSSNLTTRLAERLPGNLNQQEINLISDASSQLGKTPEANAAALASFKAGAELAQRNASRLTEAAAKGTSELIAEQRRQRERGVEEFETLADRYKEDILNQRSSASPDTSQGDGRLKYNPDTGRVE